MKLHALTFLISLTAYAKEVDEYCLGKEQQRINDLKAIVEVAKAQPAEQWTRCDYDGRMVDCKEYLRLVNKERLP